MRLKERQSAFRCARSLLTLVLGLVLFASPLAAEPKTERCPGVSLQSEAGLALGTVRTLSGVKGFIEVHPRHGISVSSDGVVHQGPWGAAVLHLTGPAQHRVVLDLAIERTSTHHAASLRLVELIVSGGGETQRLDAEGASLALRLPDHESPDGRVRMRLEIGAVAAFRHNDEPQQASYRLIAVCASARP